MTVHDAEHDINVCLAAFVAARLQETRGTIGTPQTICAASGWMQVLALFMPSRGTDPGRP